MNDLLQLKKHHHHHQNQQQTSTKIANEKESRENNKSQFNTTSVSHINHQLQSELDNNNLGRMIKEKTSSSSTNNHHKRPSISCEISSKRIKGHDTIKATPQLLQQLMTTTGLNHKVHRQKQQQQPIHSEESSRWTNVAQSKTQQNHHQQQQQQPASSNSVLMNLLVSGCDVSAGYYTCLPRPKVAKA